MTDVRGVRAAEPAGTRADDAVPIIPARSEGDAFALTDWGLLAGTALIWGASFLFIAFGLESFPPTLVTLLRLVFGAATLALFPSARQPVPRAAWFPIGVAGVLGIGIPFVLFPVAQQWIDSSLAGMLNGAVPLTTAAVATVLTRRLPGRRQQLGLLAGFAGVVAISWPAMGGAEATALGTGLVLVAVVLYGVGLNLAVPLQRKYGALAVYLRAQAVSAIAVAPLGLASLPNASFSWTSLLAVLALGALGTGLAFVLLGKLTSRVGATRGSVTVYFTPIVAVLLGVAFRSETVAIAALVGIALVLSGAWLTSRKDERQAQEG
jgi:drug/metabolite transporter (DMT)-like permease